MTDQYLSEFYDNCGIGWRSICSASDRDKIPFVKFQTAAIEVCRIVTDNPDAILAINYYREIRRRARLVDTNGDVLRSDEEVWGIRKMLADERSRGIDMVSKVNLYWIIGSSLAVCTALSVVIHYGQ